METRQMMELLLARMNASMKEHMPEMKVDRKTDQARMEAKIDAHRERDQKDLKGMMEEMNAMMDGNQAELRSTVCAMRSEWKETIQHEIKAVIQPIRSELDEKTACNEATETAQDPGMMQPIDEHQEIPKGETAVMLVGGLWKRRRVQNLAAGPSQKKKERTTGNSGPKRKSAAACKRVSPRAKVAWRKRNLFRRTGTKENCGSQKRVTVTDRKLTPYTGVVWLNEKVRRPYECRKGLEGLGGRLPLCLRNERASNWTYRETIDSVKIAKQSYVSSRKIKDLILWRVRPFQNEKKLHIERKPVL
jgi:hypothetical protein